MTEFFDDLETRAPEVRERAQFAALGRQIANAKANTPRLAESLAGVEPGDVADRAALARLPVIRKSELMDLQRANPPFGGLTAVADGALGRILQSPGPIYEPEGGRGDFWRMERAMFAAGFRAGDVAHNTFSYHLTPGGLMMDAGCRALGCAVIPAGVGQTEQQVEAIAHIRPNAYVGTPSFLRILLDKLVEAGVAIPFRKAMVGGEALPPSLRGEFEARGVAVRQNYGTADLGLIAYETPALEGMVIDEGVIVEIVRPGTGDPVAEGEVGEVVVTTLTPEYPLIRFATGDMSAVMAGASPCGRTNTRIKGWMGRADQTTKVKGMFVHPGQVNQVVKQHPQVARARLVVDNPDNTDVMTLRCESGEGGAALAEAIAATIQSVCKVRGLVEFVPPGTLPNDGKVIDDLRKFE
ncbi:MAG: AMP-binding protein [Hyphomicrobiales bacterium]|nr:AMP-binding protein [Hyphomicrobiales bacterium]